MGARENEDTCPRDEVGAREGVLERDVRAGGHLEVLKWARENDCPWDEYTCRAAAKGGHLETLKWARENGCPWDA